jgi:hypothetical protein
MTAWQFSVRRVDVPAGRYEPHPALQTFTTEAEATEAARAFAAAARERYTPSIYEVRSRGRRLVYVARAHAPR